MNKKRRKSSTSPTIIGLTGSIGMGKTTVAAMFRRLGVAVCDSDAIVHRLLSSGGKAVAAIESSFPGVRGENGIDRKSLGRQVFSDKRKLAQLEAILHPLVQEEQRRFVFSMRQKGKKIVLLDIPLLFETKAEARCNVVVVVTAPAFLQQQRVLRRAGMTKEKLSQILARQMPDRQKRKVADYSVHTGLGLAYSTREVKRILTSLGKRSIKNKA